MAKKPSKEIENVLTKKRCFVDSSGKKIEREFIALIQNVSDQEVLYLYELISQHFGNNFTIDMIKQVPEEQMIHTRVSFLVGGITEKATLIFDIQTFELIFDNRTRLLAKAEELKMQQLIKGS